MNVHLSLPYGRHVSIDAFPPNGGNAVATIKIATSPGDVILTIAEAEQVVAMIRGMITMVQ